MRVDRLPSWSLVAVPRVLARDPCAGPAELRPAAGAILGLL
jgi:hypothetical protein